MSLLEVWVFLHSEASRYVQYLDWSARVLLSYPFPRTLLLGFSRHTCLVFPSVQTPRRLCLAALAVSLGPQAFSSGICAFGLQLFCVFQLSTGESEL